MCTRRRPTDFVTAGVLLVLAAAFLGSRPAIAAGDQVQVVFSPGSCRTSWEDADGRGGRLCPGKSGRIVTPASCSPTWCRGGIRSQVDEGPARGTTRGSFFGQARMRSERERQREQK
jgi:hypothetical protein